jgi:hypothetical protein
MFMKSLSAGSWGTKPTLPVPWSLYVTGCQAGAVHAVHVLAGQSARLVLHTLTHVCPPRQDGR